MRVVAARFPWLRRVAVEELVLSISVHVRMLSFRGTCFTDLALGVYHVCVTRCFCDVALVLRCCSFVCECQRFVLALSVCF